MAKNMGEICTVVCEAAFPGTDDMEGPLFDQHTIGFRLHDLVKLLRWAKTNPDLAEKLIRDLELF